MFTQCAECNTAFRVTADVLKKAAGQVRCGGCGVAFNALEYLSEEMPKSAPRAQPNEHVPELTPETSGQDNSVLQSISAEQSAALLKTLDELAGSNITIEDTGVEWRVLDTDTSDDEPDAAEQKAAESQLITDTGSMQFVIESDDDGAVIDISDIFEAPGVTFIDSNLDGDSGDPIIDEFLIDSPTPVDQFLTQTPSQIDAPEVFEHSAAEAGVMRFDDNTPLPDDFNLGDSAPYVPRPPPPEVERIANAAEDVDPQVDLAFGEPDEWEQLLGEVDESTTEESDAKEIETVISSLEEDSVEDEYSIEEDLRSIADVAAGSDADDTPLDMDTQFAIQAEAMGIVLSGMHKSIADDLDNDKTGIDDLDPESQDDNGKNNGEEDEQESATVIANGNDELEVEPEPDEEPDEDQDDEPGQELDDASEEDLSVEEQPDLAASAAADSDDSAFYRTLVQDLEEFKVPVDDGLLEFDDEEVADLDELEPEDAADDSIEAELGGENDQDSDDATIAARLAELNDEDDQDSDDATVEARLDDQETSIDEDLIAAAFESEASQPAAEVTEEIDDETGGEHYVPEQTEEEKTINMMIDQDFMRLAAEGEDIFTSNVIDDRPDFDDNPNVETIVMEGEFVRSALDREKLAADAAAGSHRYDATKIPSRLESGRDSGIRGEHRGSDPAGIGVIAGTIALALILIAQVLHQSREALAQVPTFNQTIGPLYRAVGFPLTPSWNVTGWRIEVAKGSTDENGELLTIYSRIGNTSDSRLPYPLIHVALIDRVEDSIGSKVLEPREYLAGNPDPSKAVEAGETFDAFISIESPAAEALSFRLMVCYRLANRQLSCATEDFK
jgi:predicted Zn finger-like uncharacterized protein